MVHPRDPKRRDDQPRVFLGPIASANTLLKDAALRDLLRDIFGVRAIEVEGAGIAHATWTRRYRIPRRSRDLRLRGHEQERHLAELRCYGRRCVRAGRVGVDASGNDPVTAVMM